MAVKITQTGIDTVQSNTVTSSKFIDGSITADDLPSGCIINSANTTYTTLTAFTVGTGDTDFPGLSVNITAKGNNSKFLIIANTFGEVDGAWDIPHNIHKNGTRINIGTTSGKYGLALPSQTYAPASNNVDSTPELMNIVTLDTTGSIKGTTYTFKVVASSPNSARTYTVNRAYNNIGSTNYEQGTSEITVLEIKG